MKNTLEKLIDLRNFINNKPSFPSTKWHKETTCDYQTITILKKNRIVKNMGAESKPHWVWSEIIPNVKMAQRVETEKKRHFGKYKSSYVKKKDRVVVKQQSNDFADVLYGLRIDLSDNISFTVNRNNAMIARKDNGAQVEFDNINVFKSVLSLLK